MEVHHHAHTSRKKWTHYLWEFLMLFLAVFCGFLAELQLEHRIEHRRAKEYASNLHRELVTDTMRLGYLIARNDMVSGKLDTLSGYLAEWPNSPVTTGTLYYYGSYTTKVDHFSPNNATIEELKGSGNLRLLKSKVALAVSEYDKTLRELEKEYALSKTEFEQIESFYFRIFDGYTMNRLSPVSNNIANPDSLMAAQIPLLNDDAKLLKEFNGWLSFESGIYRMQSRRYLVPLKKTAEELITLLKKEYHLD